MKDVMRKYQPIWNELKQNDEVEIKVAHPALVQRIKQAVIKEKHNDLAFRLLNEMFEYRLYISFNKQENILKFVLKQRYGLSEKEI